MVSSIYPKELQLNTINHSDTVASVLDLHPSLQNGNWIGLVLYATFSTFRLYRGGQFYWWRKTECPDHRQVTVKLCHILQSSQSRYRTRAVLVRGEQSVHNELKF